MKIWTNFKRSVPQMFVAIMVGGVFGVASSSAFAGADSNCHFHGDKPAAEATVVTCAEQNRDRLIAKGKLEASWANVKHSTIEQVDSKKGRKEWKLTFKDPSAKDKTKESMFMFFSMSGNHIATNFSGN